MSDEEERYKVTRKTIPTKQSLDKSEHIAKALGMTFNRSAVAVDGRQLHKNYYRDICKTLNLPTNQIEFDSGRLNTMEVFVAPLKGRDIVVFDDFMDFWVQDLNFLLTFSACYHFSKEETVALTDMVQRRLDWTGNHESRHSEFRDELWPLVSNFVDILPAANALTMTQVAFMLCHEIAHSTLGHLSGGDRYEIELEADHQAFEYLLKVKSNRDKLTYLKINDSTLGAPSLSLLYLSAMSKKNLGVDSSTKVYPSFEERAKKLERQASLHWNDRSVEKFQVLSEKLCLFTS